MYVNCSNSATINWPKKEVCETPTHSCKCAKSVCVFTYLFLKMFAPFCVYVVIHHPSPHQKQSRIRLLADSCDPGSSSWSSSRVEIYVYIYDSSLKFYSFYMHLMVIVEGVLMASTWQYIPQFRVISAPLWTIWQKTHLCACLISIQSAFTCAFSRQAITF